MSRKVVLIGEINEEAYLSFHAQVQPLIEKSTKPIDLELCSSGGDIYIALAIADRIRYSEAPFRIKANGQVMSAAVLILAAGAYRAAYPSTWFMVHESTQDIKGSISYLNSEAQQQLKEEQQWYSLMARYTKTNSEVWRELCLSTSYFNAKMALELGLIDKIIGD